MLAPWEEGTSLAAGLLVAAGREESRWARAQAAQGGARRGHSRAESQGRCWEPKFPQKLEHSH